MAPIRFIFQQIRNQLGRSPVIWSTYAAWQKNKAILACRLQRRQRGTVVFFCTGPLRLGSSSRLRGADIAVALRRRGWRTIIVDHLCTLDARKRIIEIARPDVIILQKSGHPLNRPNLYAPIPTIFDLDDADFADANFHQGVLECCTGSCAITAGSRFVGDWCRQYNSNVSIVWTGTRLPTHYPSMPPSSRPPIVAWGHSRPMSATHEADFLAALMSDLAKMYPGLEFWLYGFDYSPSAVRYVNRLRQAGVTVRTHTLMSFKAYVRSLRSVAVGVQPLCPSSTISQGKSFGKILAYISAGVPVVASNTAEHPLFFRHGENGMLAETHSEWLNALSELISNHSLRDRISHAAWDDFHNNLSLDCAAEKIETVIKQVIDRKQQMVGKQ